MECGCCSRGPEKDRPFFCSSCLSSRLSDHHQHRLRAHALLDAQKRKNEALLRPSEAHHLQPSPGARLQPLQAGVPSPPFGVEQERLLKASKRSLAARVIDLREAVEVGKAGQALARTSISDRRAALARRRSNLSEAQALLVRLTAQRTTPSATSDRASLPALEAHLAQLQTRHEHLRLQIAQVRAILIKELLVVYGFGAVLPSPSSSALAANMSPFIEVGSPPKTPSSSISTVSSRVDKQRYPTYSIAGLPLPPMSHLLNLPPAVLSASLSHLVHLTRLLALYTTANPLPFTPFPSLYGPGQPGVRAAPGWPTAMAGGGTALAFPLFLAASKRKKTSSEPELLTPSPGRSGVIPMEEQQQTGGLVALAGLTNRSELGREGREEERREAERKVRKGAIALAFDLAWLAWSIGTDLSAEGTELEDLGALVLKAAASTVLKPPSGGGVVSERAMADSPSAQAQPRVRPERAANEVFPWDWDKLVGMYVVEREVESVVLIPRGGEEGGAGEGVHQSDEDEWDVV